MAIDKEIIALLGEFGKNITIDLKKNLRVRSYEHAVKAISKSKKKGNSATQVQSRLEASILANPVKYVDGGLLFTLSMNDYWDAVNSGRNPTSKGGDGSLKRNLIRWIKTRKLKVEISKRKTKKIDTLKSKGKLGKKIKKVYKQQTYEQAVEQMAYGIAQKIHKDGYEGNNFFTEIIKDGRIEQLQSEIGKLINTEIIIDIQQATKQ